MALIQVEFVKDRFIYMPQMGMYWLVHGVKRVSGEDDNGYWDRVKKVDREMQGFSGASKNEYHPCLFLLTSQVYGIPQAVRVPMSAVSYLMVADTSFNDDEMPAHAEWNPVDFVWKSNRNVLMNQYKGTNKTAAEWMSHRFPVINPQEVEALTDFPSGAYDPWAVVPPPPPPPDDGEPDGEDEPDSGSTIPSGGLTLHMACPHCGKKIF